jgi:hypothetical protein
VIGPVSSASASRLRLGESLFPFGRPLLAGTGTGCVMTVGVVTTGGAGGVISAD